MEEELAQHVLKLEERLFGLTISDIRRLAFQLASRNKIPKTFSVSKGMAGKAWFYNFMKRHPYLSLRQPEKISLASAAGFNRRNVNEFFNVLERTVDAYGFTTLTIYNVDESGFSTVQKRNRKIVGSEVDIVECEDGPEVENTDSTDSEDNIPLIVLRKINSKNEYKPPNWHKLGRERECFLFTSRSGVPDFVRDLKTPNKLFNLFFTDEVINNLVFQTNLYAQQEHMKTGKFYLKTDFTEMKAFLDEVIQVEEAQVEANVMDDNGDTSSEWKNKQY
ncbi:hypothetical protein MML48_9g00005578 [Holotrichia oblita]|uniref:Uncharacterized protein n=1 Tax=Holotrichia oblita TaxID=644536 RepID=A0ACB9SK75_HOLOL|nr:hypothetical protein MML48_9g00005578 [Holotrichia oblita]